MTETHSVNIPSVMRTQTGLSIYECFPRPFMNSQFMLMLSRILDARSKSSCVLCQRAAGSGYWFRTLDLQRHPAFSSASTVLNADHSKLVDACGPARLIDIVYGLSARRLLGRNVEMTEHWSNKGRSMQMRSLFALPIRLEKCQISLTVPSISSVRRHRSPGCMIPEKSM